jgi:Domain of unknown function (DUF4126)
MDGPLTLLPVALGVGLAASTGFRVFLPLLVMGLAARWGVLPVSESFAWVGSTPALVMLAVAAILEIAAYYVPFVDNLLDGIAGPLAITAGVAVSAAVMGDYPPMLKWTLAIIAGGGAAAATQGATTLLRGTSTALTGGLGNHAVATGEIFAALALSLLSIVLPYLALALALVMAVLALRWVWRARIAK